MNEFITGKMDAVFAHQLEQFEKDLRINQKTSHPSITISREFGCEGFRLAALLKEKLHTSSSPWSIYGRDTLHEITSDTIASASFWESVPSETRSIITQYLDASLAHKPTDLMVFKKIAKGIKVLTSKGHSIIVGAAGAALSQHNTNAFNFRLIAHEDFKIQHIIQMGFSAAEAKVLVKERDEQRAKFVFEHTGKDIRDPHLYMQVFNNSKLSVHEIANQIVEIVKART